MARREGVSYGGGDAVSNVADDAYEILEGDTEFVVFCAS